MLENLSGATRLMFIVGDPIAQVKSPSGVTRMLEARGHDAIVVPAHVAPADLDGFMRSVSVMQNLDAMLVTVPHKMAMFRHCASVTDRAGFLKSVNLIRRCADGWHGDMTDGLGFTGAQRAGGCLFEGQRALLVGAGGAGSAIALALLEAGVAELAVHDADAQRRDALLTLMAARFGSAVSAGSNDPAGFDIICNASPSGMRVGDTPPVQLDRLTSRMFVGDVVTAPEITPVLAAARSLGCATSTGGEMFRTQMDLMVDFLTGQ